jgi:TPR repeat protein
MKTDALATSVEVCSDRFRSQEKTALSYSWVALRGCVGRWRTSLLLYVAICFTGLLAGAQQVNDLSNLDLGTLQQRAQAGDAEAQAEMGYRYINGRGVGANYNQARLWVDQSAGQGNARGAEMLAWFYSLGYGGLPRSETQAYKLLRLAAEQGRVSAQAGLAIDLKNGKGVCQDLAESAAWSRKAADHGSPGALLQLAIDYELGIGVSQDVAEARRWYEKGATLANDANFAIISKSALTRLDAWSASGQSIERVDLPAVGGCALSLETLAERGNAGDADAKAQRTLAEKQGDLPTRRLAALGDAGAEQHVGDIYFDNKDYERAEFWMKRALHNWGPGNGTTVAYALVKIAVMNYRPNEPIPPEEMAAMFRSSGPNGSSESDFRMMPATQVLKMLANANDIVVNIRGTNFPGHDRDDEEWGKACNGKRSKESAYAGENACFQVFTHYQRQALSDLTNAANLNYVMSALLRGCGIYAPSDDKAFRGRTCGLLGRTLYGIGNEEAGRAVWELAPGCYSQDERSGTPLNGCIRTLTGMDGQFFRDTNLKSSSDVIAVYSGEPHRLARMMWNSCTTIHDRESCEFLQSNGATVDMAAVGQMENARSEGIEEFRAQRKAENEQAQADAEARRNAIFSTLASMGGSNPTAVLDAGNRQAAALRAIGDANAGHRQNVVLQATSGGAQTIAASNSASYNTNSPSSSVPGNNTTNLSPGATSSAAKQETCPNTMYPDMGASCNPVRSMMQCVQVASSSWIGNASNQYFGLLTVVFTNTCTQTIRLTTEGGDPSTNSGGELSNVGAGQQYTFSDSQHNNLYFYVADDGTDCSVNNSRPGCNSSELLQTK